MKLLEWRYSILDIPHGRPYFSFRRPYRNTKRKRKGVGKALYTAFIEYAESQNVRRVEWVVLDWNTHAINFYKGVVQRFLKIGERFKWIQQRCDTI